MPSLRIHHQSLTTLAVLLAAAVIGLGLAGCGGSSNHPSASASGSSAPVAGTIADAAYKTTAARGAHVALSGTITTPGASAPLTLSGSGTANFAGHEGTFSFTLAGLPSQAQAALGGGSLQLNEVMKGRVVYIGSPLFAGKLPGGAQYMKIDIAHVAQGLGLDPSSLTSGGAEPAQYLQDLRAAGGKVTVVGHEDVRGVPTTHYSATVDLVKAAEAAAGANSHAARELVKRLTADVGVSSIPMEVWVDGQGLVRKIAVHISAQGTAVAIEIEFFEFGATPPVSVPSGSEVFEVSPQTLHSLTGS